MKKYFTVAIGIIFSFCLAVNTFAATIKIENAVQQSTGEIKVECGITSPNDSQAITIVSCEYGDETFSKDIIYINQFNAEISSDNKFSFNFLPANWTDSTKAYIVRVGGYGIETPDSMLIAFYNEKIYKAGDINGDGDINKIDAALLLKYISETSDLNGAQIAAGDVNKDSSVDMLDVVEILNHE